MRNSVRFTKVDNIYKAYIVNTLIKQGNRIIDGDGEMEKIEQKVHCEPDTPPFGCYCYGYVDDKAKLVILDEDIVGFYIYLPPSISYIFPVISHIYVDYRFRNIGIATKIVEDFMNMYPDEKYLALDSPCNAMINVLIKMGLIEEMDNKLKPTGRLHIVSLPCV